MSRKVSIIRISIAQIRAARALLDWTQPTLAEAAGLSSLTVKRLEGSAPSKVSEEAIAKIRAALESAGVEFTNGSQPGVRLRKV